MGVNAIGELGALCIALDTIPHMGQPLFGAKPSMAQERLRALYLGVSEMVFQSAASQTRATSATTTTTGVYAVDGGQRPRARNEQTAERRRQ